MPANTFYVAANSSSTTGGGIYSFTYRHQWVRQTGYMPFAQASFLDASADGNYLYAVGTDNGQGQVAAFYCQDDGILRLLNNMPLPEGVSACHLAVAPKWDFLFCAIYREGQVVEFKLRDGALQLCNKVIQHQGNGPCPRRQTAAHAHFTCLTPDNNFLCVVDLGIDSVICYPLENGKGINSAKAKRFAVSPGAGPRHLAFALDGKHAYLLNELANTVMTLKYQAGNFELLQTLSTLPDNFHGESTAAAIRVSPDQRYVLASNRGLDSVAVFQIQNDATLAWHDLVPSGGKAPRDANFLPGYKKFATANESANNVCFFDFDESQGKLTPDGNVLTTLPGPRCIFWPGQ